MIADEHELLHDLEPQPLGLKFINLHLDLY